MNYRIEGDTLPVVIMNLEAGESIITEGGGMSWMSPNMLMETTTNGGIGKVLGRAFREILYFKIFTQPKVVPAKLPLLHVFRVQLKLLKSLPAMP